MKESFKILTLNCWGVFFPVSTVRKNDRLLAIAHCLSKGLYDIILLQEIWLESDYKKMKSILSDAYAHSTYFHCHTIGSGMCVFSKWSIESVFFHPYSANGYPYLIHQADWYCGKGVGLARVISPRGFSINLYVTHMIARYVLNRHADRFNGHRVAQLMELIEFVHMSSSGADATIIAGDFNWESDTFAIELLQKFLKLSDAWLDNDDAKTKFSKDELEFSGCTCDRADNPYRNQAWTIAYENGERLDYIFYRAGPSVIDASSIPANAHLTCDKCWLDMREVTDDPKGLHYSDHEGVAASFTIERLDSAQVHVTRTNSSDLTNLLQVADSHLNRGLDQCERGKRVQYGSAICVAITLWLLILSYPTSHWLVSVLKISVASLLGIILFLLSWGSVIGRTIERNALQNAKQIIKVQFASLKDI